MKFDKFNNKVGFAIGTGRCGTHFIDRIVKNEPGIVSKHERHPMSDAFHRYCKWYKLEIDDAGFLEIKKRGLEKDLTSHNFSFEASAYLSLSVKELYESFGARFLLLLRRPDKMVNSYIQKGWYQHPMVRSDYDLPPGFQPYSVAAHHYFSRIAPVGDEAIRWRGLSQVGKLAWYWKVLNREILNIFNQIPKTHYKIVKIENVTYEKYLSIAEFMKFSSSITQSQFESISNKRPGSLNPARTVRDWHPVEIAEFEKEVYEVAENLKYEWRVNELSKLPERDRPRQKSKIYMRFRRKIAQIKRAFVHPT